MEALTSAPDLWDRPEQAQALLSEKTHLQEAVESCLSLEKGKKDALELFELAETEGDEEVMKEAEASLDKILLFGNPPGGGRDRSSGLGRDAFANVHAFCRPARI